MIHFGESQLQYGQKILAISTTATSEYPRVTTTPKNYIRKRVKPWHPCTKHKKIIMLIQNKSIGNI